MDPFAPPIDPNLPPGAPFPGEMGALDPQSALIGSPQPPITLEPQANGVFGVNPMAMGGTGDNVLDQMLAGIDASAPVPPNPALKKRENRPPAPDEGFCREMAAIDQMEYSALLDRFSRDLSIYRQHEAGTPLNFNDQRDPQFVSAAMSTLVNKLSAMLSGPETTYEVEYTDLPSEKNAQLVEDFAHLCRQYERRYYAVNGGSDLQRDEFWYLLLHGRLVYRVLPDFNDVDYPFTTSIIDPSTCYPYFGGGKQGMIRMTREFNLTLGKVVEEYAAGDHKLRKQILSRLRYDEKSYRENYHVDGTVREYWDKDYRAVYWQDVAIIPPVYHGFGVVPFVYVTAVGEPMAVHTPQGRYTHYSDEFGHYGRGLTRDQDLAEKGVSVFHHLVNTHRIGEALHTLLLIEVYKAGNPSTVTYSAPHLMGEDIPPLDTGIGGNNHRMLGLQKVEGLPTSPRPTDSSPLLGKLDSDWYTGSLPPGAMGNESGSNISGFAVNSLLASAKEMVLPYSKAWEMAQQLKMELKLIFYRDLIAPITPIHVGHKVNYGAGYQGDYLTPDVIRQTGTIVKVKLSGISSQERPQVVAAVSQMMQAGIISQRRAMEMLEIRRPDQMFNEILSEKALQHPMLQEMSIIPEALIEQGYPKQFVDMWMMLVVTPKLPQIGMVGPGGTGGPEAPGGPAAPPGAQMTGQGGAGAPVPPDQGQNPSAPGGPAIGEGRGPAPQPMM